MVSAKTIIEFLKFTGFERMEWDESEITCYYPNDTQPFGAAEFVGETWDRWAKIELSLSGHPPFKMSLKDFPNS